MFGTGTGGFFADNSTSGLAGKLAALNGLTFFKDYRSPTSSLNADYSAGSSIATYASARGASNPSTYVDGNGVIQLLTTANVRRRQGGYYDSTGFHPQSGETIEAARTNLSTRTDGTASGSGLWTGWTTWDNASGTPTPTQVAIPELTSISGANSQRFTYTGSGDTNRTFEIYGPLTAVGSVVNTNVVTVSVWIRSQTVNTSTLSIAFGIASANDVGTTLNEYKTNFVTSFSSSWVRIVKTATITDATCSRALVFFSTTGIDTGDNVDVEFYAPQLEISQYATSFIPTTTAALTSAADGTAGLSYVTSGNCTNAAETTFIKYAPFWAAASPTTGLYLLDSDADIVDMAFVAASDSFQYRPNGTDDAANVALAASDPAINTSYVMTTVSYGATAATNAEIFVNGVTKGSTATDYTEPAIGTNFYIGSKADASLQLGGIVQAVVKYNRALSATEIVNVVEILNSGLV